MRYLISILLVFALCSPALGARLDAYPNETPDDDADEFIYWDTSEGAVKNATKSTLTSVFGGLTTSAGNVTLTDAGGYFSGTDAEAALQEVGAVTTDPELTALAGTTSAADQMPYYTGPGSAGTTGLTAYGRSLVDDVDAAAARQTLGAIIGQDVQAWDQQLEDVSGLSYAGNAGKVVKVNGTEDGLELATVSASPGGADGQLQVNSGGVFGGALLRQAGNTISLYSSTSPTAFEVFNTRTDATNGEWAEFKWDSNVLDVGPNAAGTGTGRKAKYWLHGDRSYGVYLEGSDGYRPILRNRYGFAYYFGDVFVTPASIAFAGGASGAYVPSISTDVRGSTPPRSSKHLNVSSHRELWLMGLYGGPYAASTGHHNGTGVHIWAGEGATPTDANADGGDAGNVSVWLNSGGAGAGTGNAGADGKFQIVDDATDSAVFEVDVSGNVFAYNLPTSDPAVAGQVWNDAGTLKISAGP